MVVPQQLFWARFLPLCNGDSGPRLQSPVQKHARARSTGSSIMKGLVPCQQTGCQHRPLPSSARGTTVIYEGAPPWLRRGRNMGSCDTRQGQITRTARAKYPPYVISEYGVVTSSQAADKHGTRCCMCRATVRNPQQAAAPVWSGVRALAPDARLDRADERCPT